MVTVVDTIRPERPRHPEKAHRPDTAVQRKPPWIRVKAPTSAGYHETRRIVRENQQYQRLVSYEFRGPNKLGDRVREGVMKHTTLPPGFS